MRMKQAVKDKESLEGMLDTKTKELEQAKKSNSMMKSAIRDALLYAPANSSSYAALSSNAHHIRDILNKCMEATKKE